MTKWGIIGAGQIARVFANGLRFSASGSLVAVASLTEARGSALASDFGIPKRYTRYEDLLRDEEIEAVYISLIHPLHAQWAIAAANAGKHLLVEKPMAMSAAEAETIIAAAKRNDVFLMEAFMYRCHPQLARFREIIQDGAIGEVQLVRAALSFAATYDPKSRLFDPAQGGGAIMDVGCYPASVARFVAGAATDAPFAEPARIKACGVIGETGVDTFTVATAEFPNGILAELTCGVTCDMAHEVTVFGTKGHISLSNPWLPSSPARSALEPLPENTVWPTETIRLWKAGETEPEEIVVTVDRDLFSYEADTVDRYIADRQAPQMTWEDTIGNMRFLDAWRTEIGARLGS